MNKISKAKKVISASTINNMDDLRDHAIRTIQRLERKEIDCAEAGVTGKLYENVISSTKTQIQYDELRGVTPNIKFLESGSTVNARKLKTVKTKQLTKRK